MPHQPTLFGRTLKELETLDTRQATSQSHAKAVEICTRELDLHGLTSRKQTFEVPTSSFWHPLFTFGLLAAGTWFAWEGLPVGSLGFILCVLGAWWSYTHFRNQRNPMDFFIPTDPTQNVIADFGEGQKHLILMAHLDTPASGFGMELLTGKWQSTHVWIAVLTPIVVLLRLYEADIQPVVTLLTLYFGILTAISALWYNNERTTGPFADNALGVATAMAVAEHLWGKWPLRVSLVLTSGRGTRALGIRAYLKTLNLQNPKDALVIHFCPLESEGLSIVEFPKAEHPKMLIESTEALHSLPVMAHPLRSLETEAFANVKIPSLTLAGLESTEDGLTSISERIGQLAQVWTKLDKLN